MKKQNPQKKQNVQKNQDTSKKQDVLKKQDALKKQDVFKNQDILKHQDVLKQQNKIFKYFHDVVLLLSSTLDMPKVMRDTYELLAQHFPLEAISLHQSVPDRTSLTLLFFVRNNQFELVRRVVNLPPGTVIAEPPMDQASALISIPDNMCNPVSRAHAQSLSDLLAPVSRAYLIGMLQADGERIGHLCLIGNKVNCFTAEH